MNTKKNLIDLACILSICVVGLTASTVIVFSNDLDDRSTQKTTYYPTPKCIPIASTKVETSHANEFLQKLSNERKICVA